MKLKSFSFWIYLVVVIYLVAMLVFVSIEFFGKADIAKISAFGSVLGGVGAVFAGFVAIYLFNDWKTQENAVFRRNIAITIYNDMGSIYTIITTPKYEKHTVEVLQTLFNKVNYNFILLTKFEPQMRDVIKSFGLIYIRHLGYFEKEKNDSVKIPSEEKDKFEQSYGPILHSFAELAIRLDIEQGVTNTAFNSINAAVNPNTSYLDNSKNEFLKELKLYVGKK